MLIAGGAAALAFLPGASIAWTFIPQVLAGAGMGLALPAFSDERDVPEAARNLVARHVGIVIVLAILAPVATAQLETTTDRAILQGAALVLDAQIDPLQKLRARARAARQRRRRRPARRADAATSTPGAPSSRTTPRSTTGSPAAWTTWWWSRSRTRSGPRT